MSRIKDYPEATSMADDDILVIDGDAGTRKVKKSKFVEIISEHVDGEIEEMRQDFQDGVDTIYNAIVAEGVTPASSTPSACAVGIHDVYTKGVTDTESVTWVETVNAYSQKGQSNLHLSTNYVVSIRVESPSRTFDDNANIVNAVRISQYKSNGDPIKINGQYYSNVLVYVGTTLTLDSECAYVEMYANIGSSTMSGIYLKLNKQAKQLR